MKRQYTICTEHLIIIKDEDKGSCSQCNGDHNLIGVAAIRDLKEEYKCPKHGFDITTCEDEKGGIFYCAAETGYDKRCMKVLEVVPPWKENETITEEQYWVNVVNGEYDKDNA